MAMPHIQIVEIICTKHAYVQDPPDLTLFNFMQDTESIPLVNLLRKNYLHTHVKYKQKYSIAHKTVFNRESLKLKTPTIYYVTWRSYDNLIQTYKAYHKFLVQ